MSAARSGYPSELGQDQFVLEILDHKRDGFFLEFGAMDGIRYSNTIQLEQDYGWTGIIGDPNPRFHDSLFAHRRSKIDNRVLYKDTGHLIDFVCREGGISCVPEPGQVYDQPVLKIESVSLNDLLNFHDAPDVIDYVSLDTEGTELDIIKAFDFTFHLVLIWTIEHRFKEPLRSHIRQIMYQNGYRLVRPDQTEYDDWFVHDSILI